MKTNRIAWIAALWVLAAYCIPIRAQDAETASGREQRLEEMGLAGRQGGKTPKVAVMAFDVVSLDPKADQWIGVGFAESLSSRLTELGDRIEVQERRQLNKILQEWRLAEAGVTSEAWVQGDSGQKFRQLRVADYLIIGSVQVGAGDVESKRVLKVDARIVSVSDGKVIPETGFDAQGDLDRYFELQGLVSVAMARKVLGSIGSDDQSRLQKPETDNLDAYQNYVKGLMARDRGEYKDAIQYFRLATQLSDSFVLALRAKGETYDEMYAAEEGAENKRKVGAEWESDARSDVRLLDKATAAAHYNLAESLVAQCVGEGIREKCAQALDEIKIFNQLNTNKAVVWKLEPTAQKLSGLAMGDGAIFVSGCENLHYGEVKCEAGAVFAVDAATGVQKWKYETNDLPGDPVPGRDMLLFVIGGDFVSAGNNYVYALNPTTGAMIWMFETPAWIVSSPKPGDGIVYVDICIGNNPGERLCATGGVYALDAKTGNLKWKFETQGEIFSSLESEDGKIFAGSWGNYVYALDAGDGKVIWKFDAAGEIGSSPVISDGTVFVSSTAGLYALDPKTGDMLWKNIDVGDTSLFTPANGFVYTGLSDKVFALDAKTGKILWDFTGESRFNVGFNPVIDSGILLICSNSQPLYNYKGGAIYALEPRTGELVWKFNSSSTLVSGPQISGGMVFAVAENGFVDALDLKSGDLIWNFDAGFLVQSEPKIRGDAVYLSTWDRVYALGMKQGTKAAPLDVDADLLQARALRLTGNPSGAVELLKASLDRKANQPGAWRELSVSYDAQGDIPGALTAAEFFVTRFDAGNKDKEMRDYLKTHSPFAWIFRVDEAVIFRPQVSDGVVIFGANNGRVYALDAQTGAQVWEFNSEPWVARPVTTAGKTFTASIHGRLYALDNKSGNILWDFEAGERIDSDLIVSGGMVCFIVGAKFYALDAGTGAVVYEFDNPSGFFDSSPALSGGVLYAATSTANNEYVSALDLKTGMEKWKFRTQGPVFSAPVVENNAVFFGSWDGNVYALDAITGEMKWKFQTGGQINFSPRVSDGVVYIDSMDSFLYALDESTGEMLWKFQNDSLAGFGPEVSGGVVYEYSISPYACVNALDPKDGELIWRFGLASGASSKPTISKGMLYIGSMNGNVYALDLEKAQKLLDEGKKW